MSSRWSYWLFLRHNSAISPDYPAVLKIKWNPCKCPTSPSHWPSLNPTPTTLSHFVGRASKPGRSTLEFNTRVSLSLGPFLFCSFFPLHPLFLLIADFWECGIMRMLCVIWVWGKDKKVDCVCMCAHVWSVGLCIRGVGGCIRVYRCGECLLFLSHTHTLSALTAHSQQACFVLSPSLGIHTLNWPGRKSLLKHLKKRSAHKPWHWLCVCAYVCAIQ